MKKILFLALFLATALAQFSDPPVFENSEWGPFTVLVDSQQLVGYTLELWGHEGDSMFGQALRIIDPNGVVIEQFESASIELVDSPELDINQNGIADIIINTYSGGAHCCSGTKIFEFGDTNEAIFDDFSECPVEFKDLDDDGVTEIIGCDSSWAYRYCSYASSALPSVVWEWGGEYYDIVNPQYPEVGTENFGYYFTQVLEQNQNPDSVYAEDHLCTSLGLTLPYLYSDQQDLAYQALKMSFNEELVKDSEFNSLDIFWQDILKNYQESPYRYVYKGDH